MNTRKMRVFQGKDGDWYVTILGGNGEKVFTSEGHENQADAEQIANDYAPAGPVMIELVDENDKLIRDWPPLRTLPS